MFYCDAVGCPGHPNADNYCCAACAEYRAQHAGVVENG